jgi:hypothetical protein
LILRRIRKYLLAGALVVIIFIAAGIALILASRWLTASDAVREKITAETTRLTGGQLHYEKLALHLLPRPHFTALQADFQIPGKVSLDTASLAIFPDLTALVNGAVELKEIVIVRPTTRIKLSESPVESGSPQKPGTSKGFQETVATVFAALAKLGPDLEIRVKDGAFGLIRPGKTELKIDRINLGINSRPGVVTLDLRCRSGISKIVEFNGSVNLETRNSDGRLKLDGLNVRALMAELHLLPEIAFSDTSLSLEVAFKTQAADSVKARVVGRVPAVEIKRQKRRVMLKKIAFKGDIEADARKLRWKLTSLKVDSAGLELGGSGTFVFGSRKVPATLKMDAAVKRIDVATAAQSFTDIAGDLAWVQSAFQVARAGTLANATCNLTAVKTAGKWTVPDIKATGSLTGGFITIPGADLDLEEVSGEVVLENERVDFKQMKGRLPYGTFDKLDARIDWQQAATLGISSPRATLALEQFYPWLVAFHDLQDLRKFITTADGDLNLSKLELSGALTSPATWKIEVAAGFKDVTIASPELKGPLHLSRGEASFKPQNLSLEKIHLKYLDADAVISSTILGNPGRPGQLNLAFDGTIGEQTLVWMRRFIALPEHLRVQPPLEISGMSLQWDDRSNVTVVGEIATAGGTRVAADAAFAPGRWQINRFELNDGISDVSLKLTRSAERIDLEYSGKLQKKTLDGLLKENKTLEGWVDGNLKASLDIKNPRSSTITGTIRGEGLILQLLAVSPVELKRFSIECQGKTARVESADLILAGTPMRLQGTAGITDREYKFDLELSADSFDAEALNKIQGEQPARAEEPKASQKEEVPINGIIRFKTPKFTFEDYTWSPLHADITIRPEVVKVTVTRADLCGISTPGTITITPEGLHLVFRPAASNQNLQKSGECLQDKPLQADSLFNLIGELEASGPAKDLVKTLQGDIAFSSDNGMIHRSNILTKIFAFLNITEVFAGKSSGLGEKGFGYDAIRAHAAIKGGVLNFDEILVDGHSMKISGEGPVNLVDKTVDVTLLVAPLKTFDRIVKRLPVIGYITGGSILSVPIRIKGSMANPEVVPLPPGAVGRGLVGILERTLKAPLEVIESFPAGHAKESPQADQGADITESQTN